MTHDLYREMLQRELDDDLTADERGMLEAHVSTCADCRLEREEYQSLSFGLSKLSRVMPEKSFVPQLELEVKRAVQAQRRTPRVPAWWRSATAAAVIVLAVGLAGYWQFAGQGGGADGRLALDSSTTQSKADTTDTKDQPVGTTNQDEASTEQAQTEPSAPELSKEQTALVITPKSVPVSPQDSISSASVPQQNADLADSVKEKNPATSATPPASHDTLGGLIGGAFGSAAAEENASAPPEDSMGLSGGRTGMLGTVQEEPTLQLGETQRMAHITESLQVAVREGDQTAQWATDSALVVEQSREQLGFRGDATIRSTNRADRVRIEQDGMEYEVRLEQPYDQGAKGIWHPALVGRVIDPSAPDSLQRPIVDYFRDHANNALQGDLLMVSEFDTEASTLRIAADLENETREYLCTLQLNADGDWELVGAPIAQ